MTDLERLKDARLYRNGERVEICATCGQEKAGHPTGLANFHEFTPITDTPPDAAIPVVDAEPVTEPPKS